MKLDNAALKDLQIAISDQLYIQIASWHLYLGDAGLSEALALECVGKLEKGPSVAAQEALAAVQVSLAGGKTFLPLLQLIPLSQVHDLEEILTPYCL